MIDKLNIYLAVILLFFSCSPEPTANLPVDYSPTEGVPAYYHFIYASGFDSEEEYLKASERLPYTEVQFERTPCFGRCPSYIVTFHSDGKAEYIGKHFVPQIGTYSGKVDVWNYGRLCWAIDKLKLLQMPHAYVARWTDDSTSILRIKNRQSDTFVEISDYGAQGPIELWTIHNAIDGIVSQIDWKSIDE